MAARRLDAGWLRGRPARDPACEGGVVSYDGEDRPPRRARHCAAPAHGMVSAGALQDPALAGGAGHHYSPQDPARQADRHRAQHARHPARVRAEDRLSHAQVLRDPGSRVDGGSSDADDDHGLLNARATLIAEVAKLHKKLLEIARADGVCRRLMTVPGVGALTALTFKTAIDDPTRIAKSRDVGPLFGLTPGRYQS